MSNVVEVVIRGVDEASNVFASIKQEGTSSFEAVESSVNAAENAMDNVPATAGHVSGSFDDMGESARGFGDVIKDVGSWMENNWKKITLGAASAGGSIEALARSQAGLNESTRRLAASVGMTEDEMRKLAIETSNVTFPLKDVLDLMETGRQQGLESAEQLQEYAMFWDTVGGATGEAATKLAQSSAGLRAVGITAGEEKEALAAFGYITEHTTENVSNFLRFLERAGPEIRAMGMDVNDAAAIMGVLEHEMGMTARRARVEFRRAVREADGDMEKLLETLGLTEEQFAAYQQKVAESEDIIQRNADLHDESYTVMQHLQHWVSELTYQYGPLIEAVSALVPLMLALGPAIKGINMAKAAMAAITSSSLIPAISGAIASTWSFTAALLANPITWVVGLILGLIGVIVLLWKNWDQVSAWLGNSWDWIRDKASQVFGWLSSWLSGIWQSMTAAGRNAWNSLTGWLFGIWDSIRSRVLSVFGNIRDRLAAIWDAVGAKVVGVWNGVTSTIRGSINAVVGIVNRLIDRLNGIRINVPSVNIPLVGQVGGFSIGLPRIPRIPMLADGGYFQAGRPTPAIIGEGRWDEAVIPLSPRVFGMLADEISSRMDNQSGSVQIPEIIIPVTLELDGRTLVRKTVRYDDEEKARQRRRTLRARGIQA